MSPYVRQGKGVDRVALKAALDHVERGIAGGEQTIAAQRSLIAELERAGADTTAQRQTLDGLKKEHWRRIQRREILMRELGADGS